MNQVGLCGRCKKVPVKPLSAKMFLLYLCDACIAYTRQELAMPCEEQVSAPAITT